MSPTLVPSLWHMPISHIEPWSLFPVFFKGADFVTCFEPQNTAGIMPSHSWAQDFRDLATSAFILLGSGCCVSQAGLLNAERPHGQ